MFHFDHCFWGIASSKEKIFHLLFIDENIYMILKPEFCAMDLYFSLSDGQYEQK